MKTFKALSALLNYPSAELQEAVGDIRRVLTEERQVPTDTLAPLLSRLREIDLFELQADYVDLFDRTPRLSLYLFEHIHGDSRERGRAMVDLHRLYRRHGLELDTRELPDYLPLFLEFLSTLPGDEAQALLAETVHILTALETRLTERGSEYAAVLTALVKLADTQPDPRAVAGLRNLPDAAPETLDQEWEEAPVSFGPGCEQGKHMERPLAAKRK